MFYNFLTAHPTLGLLLGLAVSVGATALMASAFQNYEPGGYKDGDDE
jgi:hypothetical protein